MLSATETPLVPVGYRVSDFAGQAGQTAVPAPITANPAAFERAASAQASAWIGTRDNTRRLCGHEASSAAEGVCAALATIYAAEGINSISIGKPLSRPYAVGAVFAVLINGKQAGSLRYESQRRGEHPTERELAEELHENIGGFQAMRRA
jgi:hypothetical protein